MTACRFVAEWHTLTVHDDEFSFTDSDGKSWNYYSIADCVEGIARRFAEDHDLWGYRVVAWVLLVLFGGMFAVDVIAYLTR